MKELFKRFKWMMILVGSLLLSAGILFFVIAIVNPSTITTIISIVVAAILFITGGIAITSSLLVEKRQFFSPSLAYASLLIALGVILCVDTSLLGNISIFYIAISLIVIGAVALLRTVFAIVWKDSKGWIFALLLGAAVSLTLGILALVFRGQTVLFTIVYVGLGIVLAVIGIAQIVTGIKLLNKQQ